MLHNISRSVVLILGLFVLPAALMAQYDVVTQAPMPASPSNPEYVATSNLGQFVLSGSGTTMRLVGSSGVTLNQTGTINSTVNMAVATNHDTYAAVVTGSNIPNATQVTVRVWNNKSNSGDGLLRMPEANVLAGITPAVAQSGTLPPNIGDLARVEAAMDKDNLYIAFQTTWRHVGFAVFSLASKTFTVPPTQIFASMSPNVDAIGSIPTVTCHRWATGTATSLNCHIAWAQDQGAIPMDFQPTLPYNPATSVRNVLPLPPLPDNAVFVRAISSDHFTGPSFTHYFIGTHQVVANVSRLYAANTSTLFGPITNTLVLSPSISNPIPPPAGADPYHTWVGGTQSVFCVYQEDNGQVPPTSFNVNVVRQQGLNNLLIHTSATQASFYSAGANQMGWFSIYDDGGGAPWIWRNFRRLADNIQENTVITGFNEIWPNIAPDLYVMPADTLRVYGDPSDATRRLAFTGQQFRLNLGWPYSHPNFSATQQRAHLMLDDDGIVDFVNQSDCEIRVNARGSLEYNGADLLNQNATIFSGLGDQLVPDTTEAHKPLLYFNAACTINNGSRLDLMKGQLRFVASNLNPHPALLSVLGANSAIEWDSSTIFLGSTRTTGPSNQIEMDLNAATSHNQTLRIADCRVATQNQTNMADAGILGGGTTGGRTRSDIIVHRPSTVEIVRSKLIYTHLNIKDASSSIVYDENHVSAARNALKCVATAVPSATFNLSVRHNRVYENWPIGTITQAPTDWEFQQFDQADLSQVVIQDNLLWRQSSGIQSDWTGILFSNGTNGNIISNTIHGRNPAIRTNAQNASRPFLCGNQLLGCCDGVGIIQDGTGTAAGFSKSNDISNYAVGYVTTDDDQSILLGNLIAGNSITGLKVTGDAITDLRGSHTGGNDYPARNILQNNGDSQLEVSSNGQPQLGPAVGLPTPPANWGQNIFSNNSSAIHLKHYGGTPITLTTPISFNQWSPSILTGNPVGVNADPEVEDISYVNTQAGSGSGGFTCGVSSAPVGQESSQVKEKYECQGPGDSLCLYYKSLDWYGVDYGKSYDTMKLYCEEHPFAYIYPGHVIDGFKSMGLCIPYLVGERDANAISHYNWLLTRFNLNEDYMYRRAVGRMIAQTANFFDRNLAANLFYNLMQLFPDSVNVDYAGRGIAQIRNIQVEIPEDTTAFFDMDFPPPPYGTGAVVGKPREGRLALAINPNPSRAEVRLTLDLPSSGHLLVEVLSLLGTVEYTVIDRFVGGDAQVLSIPAGTLPPGSYFVRATINGVSATERLIIE